MKKTTYSHLTLLIKSIKIEVFFSLVVIKVIHTPKVMCTIVAITLRHKVHTHVVRL